MRPLPSRWQRKLPMTTETYTPRALYGLTERARTEGVPLWNYIHQTLTAEQNFKAATHDILLCLYADDIEAARFRMLGLLRGIWQEHASLRDEARTAKVIYLLTECGVEDDRAAYFATNRELLPIQLTDDHLFKNVSLDEGSKTAVHTIKFSRAIQEKLEAKS